MSGVRCDTGRFRADPRFTEERFILRDPGDATVCRFLRQSRMPKLKPKETHIWIGDFAPEAAPAPRARRLLSGDERQKAARYRFAKDRNRYIFSRAMLRAVLGAYLQIPAERVVFAYGDYGKPRLAPDLRSDIWFSLSHAGTLTALALAVDCEIGIDIEKIDPGIDLDGIASHFFAPNEAAAVGTAEAEKRAETFFNCWVRKEAFVKGIGTGLATDFRHFDLLEPQSQQGHRPFPETAAFRIGPWQIVPFTPKDGYAGALALEDTRPRKWRTLRFAWPSAARKASAGRTAPSRLKANSLKTQTLW